MYVLYTCTNIHSYTYMQITACTYYIDVPTYIHTHIHSYGQPDGMYALYTCTYIHSYTYTHSYGQPDGMYVLFDESSAPITTEFTPPYVAQGSGLCQSPYSCMYVCVFIMPIYCRIHASFVAQGSGLCQSTYSCI